MDLTGLLQRRLLLFTGKGGVGKSTVVAGLALAARRQGKKPLIVELDAESSMRRLFGVPFVGFEPLPLADDLWGVALSPPEALAEYIESHVKVAALARLILRNPLLKAFFRTAPGVYEFAVLHKLLALLDARDKSRDSGYAYDLVLVDLPATGHALRLLTLPQALRQLIGVGPLRKVVERLELTLNDPATTALSVVTLPEDMPVSETIELVETLRKTTRLPLGMLFVNAMPERLFDAHDQEVLRRLEALPLDSLKPMLSEARQELEGERHRAELIAELESRLRLGLVRLPALVAQRFDLKALERLALACLAPREGAHS